MDGIKLVEGWAGYKSMPKNSLAVEAREPDAT
jgi:hypothetical protein